MTTNNMTKLFEGQSYLRMSLISWLRSEMSAIFFVFLINDKTCCSDKLVEFDLILG